MSLGIPQRWRLLVAHRTGGPVTVFVVAVSGYLLSAQLGFQLVGASRGLASFWPPIGWAVALLVLVPKRLRGWALAAVLPGELIADTLHGIPALTALGWGSTDIVEAALTAWLLLRIAQRRPRGDTSRDFVALAAAAVAVPFVTGLLGAAVAVGSYGGSYREAWLNWWLGDTTGILLVVPLILSFALSSPKLNPRFRLGGLVEIALVVACTIAMFGFTTTPVEFVMVLPIVFVAMKQGLRPTAVATLILGTIATVCTGRGLGPFENYGDDARVLGLQAFIATTAAVAFLISATMSERRRSEAALADLAEHDSLTGLANRRAFMECLDQVSARRSRSAEGAAVIYLDLDNFKEINDRLGHAAGDAVLIEVGRRLTAAVRVGDVVARVGGDEFAALLEPVDEGDGAELSARRLAETVQHPFAWGAVTIPIHISVGGSFVGANPDVSLADADRRLYRDKRSDKSVVHVAASPA